MRRTLLKSLFTAFLAIMLLVLPIKIDAASSGDFVYSVLSDGTAEITGYTGSGGMITIPSVIDGYTVTRIGKKAFYERTDITGVTIPDTVTDIGGWGTFYGCESLRSVHIPDSVLNIGQSAFAQCTGLQSVSLPDGLLKIGQAAFYYCSSLQSVRIPDNVSIISMGAFAYCSAMQSVVIGKGVTSIYDDAFEGCRNLVSVHIPSNVMVVEDNVFGACSSLRNVYIDFGTEKLGYGWLAATKVEGLFVPPTVQEAGGNFKGSDTLSLYGYRGSYIHNKYPDAEAYPITLIDDLTENTYQSNGATLKTYCTGRFSWSEEDAAGSIAAQYAGDLPVGKKIAAVYQAKISIYTNNPIFHLSALSFPVADSEAEIYAADYDDHLTKLDEISYSGGMVTANIFKDGYYVVVENDTAAPTTPPTQAADDPEPKLYGDADGDRVVTARDVTFILRGIDRIPTPSYVDLEYCDIDSDRKVTVLDATYIQRWLARLKSVDKIGVPAE